MIVIDANALVVALLDDERDGSLMRERLRGERISAPEIIDVEVLSVTRRLVHRGIVSPARAHQALDDLTVMPIRRTSHRRLLARCWELRDNVSAYDATYVALAEALTATLLTGDERLAKTTGIRCRIEAPPRAS